MKRYHIIVFGCQMNASDAERLSAVLDSNKYKKTEDITSADLIVVVMCSVRQAAVDRIFGLVEKFKIFKKKPTTILTGCILKKEKTTFSEFFDYVLPIDELLNEKRDNEFLNFKNSLSSERAYLPISNGCNNFCSYCVVPYTRGKLVCRDHKKIIQEAKKKYANN